MLKKILCILPILTLLYLAPGTILASDAEAESQSQNNVVTVKAYGPAAEAEAKKEAEQAEGEPEAGAEQSKEDGEAQAFSDGTEALTLQDGEEASAKPASYTDEDLYVMAHVLAGESQSCPDQEQLYVGSVVLNRKNHPSFPNTIKGVVFQKGQYSCTRDGNYYREPTQRNWANARTLLENGSVLPGNVIWQSGGRQGKGVYIKTKWHYYCY